MIFELSWQTIGIVVPLMFLGGLVDAIAGGGGLITLPAYLIAGLPPHRAIATNKLSVSIGMTASATRYIKNGYVDWALAVPSALLAVLGAMLGARLILLIDDDIIRYFLLIVLPVVALVVLRKRDLSAGARMPIPRRRQLAIICAASLVIGVYDGFYGPGAGTFLLLVFTQLARMPVEHASGNMKIANLAAGIGSLTVFLINRQPVIVLGLIGAVANLAGHYLGSGMVVKNGARIVRPIILVVLGLLFIRVIMDLAG